ncbi:MAG: DMT family transporter, partial [Candidatus Dormiibacterota bacterium]
ALRGFDPALVGAGRSVIAAVFAAIALLATRARLPTQAQLPGLIAVAIGCGIGFGLLSAIALHDVSSSHAAVVIAMLPAATAVAAVVRAGERPPLLFWVASGTGTLAVVVFAVHQGVGELKVADGLLLAALVVAGIGYSEGGRLTRDAGMSGWQVVSWGLILALPISLPVTVAVAAIHPPHFDISAVAGAAYISVISVWLGFFPWYRGLAESGIARASQVQLAQPFITLALSVWLLSERPGIDAYITAVVVLACIAVTQRVRYRRVAPMVMPQEEAV